MCSCFDGSNSKWCQAKDPEPNVHEFTVCTSCKNYKGYNSLCIFGIFVQRISEVIHWRASQHLKYCSNQNQALPFKRHFRGAGMVQWWERSPSTTVAWVPFPDLESHVCWVCCWFLSLLQGFFFTFSGFPPSTKINTSKFKFNLETVDEEPLHGNATANCQYLFYF